MTPVASHFVDTSPQQHPAQRRAKPLPLSTPWLPEARAARHLQIVDPAADVFAVVRRRSGFTEADLRGRDRHKRISLFRHVAAWLMRELTLSSPEVGRALGDRDHTTILSSWSNIDSWRLLQPRDYAINIRALTDAMLADLGLLDGGPLPPETLPAIPDLLPAQEAK